MNFQPDLAALVLDGRKTVTRRLVSDNPRSPWYREHCALLPGRDYAVCPGRGKASLGRIEVLSVRRMPLGILTEAEAAREGFSGFGVFREAWERINGSYDPEVLVWRVGFRRPGSAHSLERPSDAVVWEARGYWASQARVTVTLDPDLAELSQERVRGTIRHVSSTGLFMIMEDADGEIHVPLAAVLSFRRPHYSEPEDAEPSTVNPLLAHQERLV